MEWGISAATHFLSSRMYAFSEISLLPETEEGWSGVAAGAGDSVRSAAAAATLAFFFLEDLDSDWAGGFCTDEAAILDRTGEVGVEDRIKA